MILYTSLQCQMFDRCQKNGSETPLRRESEAQVETFVCLCCLCVLWFVACMYW